MESESEAWAVAQIVKRYRANTFWLKNPVCQRSKPMTKDNDSREAFEIFMNDLGAPDDEFNHYHLDEGNLYHLWSKAAQAQQTRLTNALKVSREALWHTDEAIEHLAGDGNRLLEDRGYEPEDRNMAERALRNIELAARALTTINEILDKKES